MPSYVMVYIEECRRSTVFSIPGIVRYLFWLGKPAIIRESEIDIMKQHLEGVYTDISISSLIKGQLYEITEGPLAGKTGKVIEMKKNKIAIEFMLNKKKNDIQKELKFARKILSKFNYTFTFKNPIYETKQIRHILFTINDYKKFMKFEKMYKNLNVISGGWYLTSSKGKMDHIKKQIDKLNL